MRTHLNRAPAGLGRPLPRVPPSKRSGEIAVLEIAARGFERPLLRRVREWEAPERGEEVALSVDPASVLVFPAEEPPADERKLMPEGPRNT